MGQHNPILYFGHLNLILVHFFRTHTALHSFALLRPVISISHFKLAYGRGWSSPWGRSKYPSTFCKPVDQRCTKSRLCTVSPLFVCLSLFSTVIFKCHFSSKAFPKMSWGPEQQTVHAFKSVMPTANSPHPLHCIIKPCTVLYLKSLKKMFIIISNSTNSRRECV
jgi:hypothetical protein